MSDPGKKCPMKSNKVLQKILNDRSRKSSIQDVIPLNHQVSDRYESLDQDMYQIQEINNESTSISPENKNINIIDDCDSNDTIINFNYLQTPG